MCNMSLALSTLVQCPEQWHPIYVCLINRSQIELNSNISICDEETTHTYTRIRHKIGKYKWAPLLCAERNPSPFSSTLLWQFAWHIWNLSVFEVLLKLICMVQTKITNFSRSLSICSFLSLISYFDGFWQTYAHSEYFDIEFFRNQSFHGINGA